MCLVFCLRQEVNTAKWPVMLEEVAFGVAFDRDVEGTVWPRGLRRVVFGARFNRGVEGVVWPVGLEQVISQTYVHTARDPVYRVWRVR